MAQQGNHMAHPYMASSAPGAMREMLEVIGVSDVEDLFSQIPESHRLARPIQLDRALSSELELRRHVREIVDRSVSCAENLNFLGAGCWQHFVPAVCDEIVARPEFATSVWGTPASDLGRNQAWFEFASQLGELVDMDFVGLPVYSWGCAVGNAVRMAARLNGRSRVVLPRHIDPERLAVLRTYCGSPSMPAHLDVTLVDHDQRTGRLDLAELRQAMDRDVAAVYVEVPSYLGLIEEDPSLVADLAHQFGAEFVVGVDPISLGVLTPPSRYGADIVVGTTQTLGVHMNCGGGVGGFIATRDEERYARQYPTLQVSICETVVPGEKAFAMTLFEQSSYGSREQGNDWTGNSVYLWAIANAVYMSVMGPQGLIDVGEAIVRGSSAAARRLAAVPGVDLVWGGGFFKEFVLNFDGTGRSVREINDGLLSRGIFGGKDLSQEFPELGSCALFCVTEVHTASDIERLGRAMEEVVR